MIAARMLLQSTVGVVIAISVAGCVRDDEYEIAEGSVTSALETSRGSGTSRFAIEAPSKTTCVDPVAAAQEAAQRPMVGLYPEGCAVKTQTGARVHVEFNACTGPFGRMHLSGGIDATFTSCQGGKANVTVQDSGNLTRNGRSMTYRATAVIAYQDTSRDVDWKANWDSTTARGRHVVNNSDLGIVIDTTTDCLSIAGTTEGHVDWFAFGSNIDGLSVCPDKCPSAGTIEVHRDSLRGEKTIQIRFDGTDVAKVTGSNGRHFTVPMICSGE